MLPNRGDRVLSFYVPRTNSRCVAFSLIQLHLKLRLVSGVEGKPLDPDHKYIIPGFVPSTIFSSVAVRVNDTEITNAGQYPLLSRFLFLTQLDPDRRKMLEQANHFEGWDGENAANRVVEVEESDEEAAAAGSGGSKKKKKKKVLVWTMSSGRFPNVSTRSGRFTSDGGRGVATFTTFLITELSGGGDKSLVLPPCDISIDFVPAEPSRSIITTMPMPDTRVEIVGAHLTVPRILPKTGSIPRALRWNYLRTKITPLIVPKDRTEFHAVVLYSGLIGRRISLLVMDHDNWEGDYRHSVYHSYNHDVESIELRVGSRVLPTSRIRANFDAKETNEMYMYVLDSLKWSLRKTGAMDMMAKNTWERGGFIWSADTTMDLSADAGYKGEAESGSVNLSMTFAKKTPDQLVIAVITEATAELQITSDGSVAVVD
jgi:hypothetical protein